MNNFEIIIGELNDHIMDASENEDCPLIEFTTNTYSETIEFMGIRIWSSDDEEREWIEDTNDYEPMDKYLMKKINGIIESIQKIKFNIVEKG